MILSKKGKHPNCPRCTRNLKDYHRACYMYVNLDIQKLHRLYGRDKNGFNAIGWYCQKCGFTIYTDRIPFYPGHQELIVYNLMLESSKK